MARLVFGMNQSLDGYVDHMAFAPSPTLFRHFIEEAQGQAGSVYGRQMYEVMRYWDDDHPEWDAEEHAFAAAWRNQPKWVVSRSLKSVGPNARLVEDDLEGAIRKLKAERDGEIEVAGPELAQSLTELHLIDEYRIYLHPVVLGHGKPYFAGPRPPLRLFFDRIGEDVIRLAYVACWISRLARSRFSPSSGQLPPSREQLLDDEGSFLPQSASSIVYEDSSWLLTEATLPTPSCQPETKAISARSSADRRSLRRTSRYVGSQLEIHQSSQFSAWSDAAGSSSVGATASMSCFKRPSWRAPSMTRIAGGVVGVSRQRTPSRLTTSFPSRRTSSSGSAVGPETRISIFLIVALPTPVRSHPARLTAKYPGARSGRSLRINRSKVSMPLTIAVERASSSGCICRSPHSR